MTILVVVGIVFFFAFLILIIASFLVDQLLEKWVVAEQLVDFLPELKTM